MAAMAMFPLGTVLLPGELLPLRVFEPRYRQLVIDLLADDVNDPEFGVTLIERGHEVGGGDHRAAVGTVARVVRIDAIDQAQYALVAAGVRRFRVNAWLPDDPYPLADIDPWPDVHDQDAAALEGLLAAAGERVATVRRLAARLAATSDAGQGPPDTSDTPDDGAGGGGVDLAELGDDPVLATYRLASLAPLGAADRYRVLAAGTLAERFEVLDSTLDDVEAVLRFRGA